METWTESRNLSDPTGNTHSIPSNHARVTTPNQDFDLKCDSAVYTSPGSEKSSLSLTRQTSSPFKDKHSIWHSFNLSYHYHVPISIDCWFTIFELDHSYETTYYFLYIKKTTCISTYDTLQLSHRTIQIKEIIMRVRMHSISVYFHPPYVKAHREVPPQSPRERNPAIPTISTSPKYIR